MRERENQQQAESSVCLKGNGLGVKRKEKKKNAGIARTQYKEATREERGKSEASPI